MSLWALYETGQDMRCEVIICVECRRGWPEGGKQAVLSEVGVNCDNVADFAHTHNITRQHIYKWWQELNREAALAISLMHFAPKVSPVAVLLILLASGGHCAPNLPKRVLRQPLEKPDRMHFHQQIMWALEISIVERKRRAFSNPLATAIIALVTASPIFAAIDSDAVAFSAFLALAFSFTMAYVLRILGT